MKISNFIKGLVLCIATLSTTHHTFGMKLTPQDLLRRNKIKAEITRLRQEKPGITEAEATKIATKKINEESKRSGAEAKRLEDETVAARLRAAAAREAELKAEEEALRRAIELSAAEEKARRAEAESKRKAEADAARIRAEADAAAKAAESARVEAERLELERKAREAAAEALRLSREAAGDIPAAPPLPTPTPTPTPTSTRSTTTPAVEPRRTAVVPPAEVVRPGEEELKIKIEQMRQQREAMDAKRRAEDQPAQIGAPVRPAATGLERILERRGAIAGEDENDENDEDVQPTEWD